MKKCTTARFVACAISMGTSVSLLANPVFDGWYADPQIRIYGDTYWVFPTTSARFGDQTSFDAFSSRDMKIWTKHPRILTTNEVTWAKGALWAPDAHEIGGKYYLFFSANDAYPAGGKREDGEPQAQARLEGYGGIGVAVADRPEGPYRDLIGRPLIDRFWNRAQPIDQYVFEYKSEWYMIYGGWQRCNLVKLAKDFKSLVPLEDGAIWRDMTPKDYTEGSVVFERNGRWRPLATGAGHHSVVRKPQTDEWLICYHRRPIPSGGRDHRVVCIDRMEFDANGDIKPVIMTK